MADQDNSTRRPQREAKKRAAAALCEQRKKKRVALSDLTNTNNNINDVVSQTEKPVSDSQKQKKKNDSKSTPVESPVTEKSEDPQLCGTYVSDIYDYLRKLEVQ